MFHYNGNDKHWSNIIDALQQKSCSWMNPIPYLLQNKYANRYGTDFRVFIRVARGCVRIYTLEIANLFKIPVRISPILNTGQHSDILVKGL